MASRTASPLLAFAMLAVAGCGMQVEATFERVGSPEGAATPEATSAFDVALVQANFTAECLDPLMVDALFCEQVKIDDMTASGQLLTVPTTLHAGAYDRASAICHQLAVAHLDGDTGVDLGYRGIEVLDQGDEYLADCRIIPNPS